MHTTPDNSYEKFILTQVEYWFGSDTKYESMTLHDRRVDDLFAKRLRQQFLEPSKVISALCGPESKNLCAVYFEDINAANQFLASNPLLQNTLKTTWAGCTIFWLRLADRVPSNLTTSSIYWISAAWVPILNLYPDGTTSYFRPQARIVTIKCGTIVWPQALLDGFDIRIIEKTFGPPIYRNSSNKYVLNLDSLARMFCCGLHLFYDACIKKLFTRVPGQTVMAEISDDTLLSKISYSLHDHAKNFPGFPLDELRVARLSKLIEEIKRICPPANMQPAQS